MTVSTYSGTKLPTHLYRCYAADGSLLYVGITHDLQARMAKHKNPTGAVLHCPAAHLWTLMDRWESESYPNRTEALAAERAAIRTEHPALNVQNRKAVA